MISVERLINLLENSNYPKNKLVYFKDENLYFPIISLGLYLPSKANEPFVVIYGTDYGQKMGLTMNYLLTNIKKYGLSNFIVVSTPNNPLFHASDIKISEEYEKIIFYYY